ncbi:MAG: hypothetical protein QOD06_3447 [Candidatus Binatota bacterium]|nr:hypothetical protein [Candidatus Binatota bacterium]
MLKRFLMFLVAGALLIGFGYVFYLNPGVVEFRFSGARTYKLPLPMLVLISFLAGAVAIFLLALVRETQWTLRDVRRRRSEQRAERKRATIDTGRKLQWQGAPEQARSVLRRAAPKEVEAALALAETDVDSGRAREARDLLERTRAKDPENPRLLWLLARAERRLGHSGAAAVALEQALALEPKSPRLLAELRDAYVAEGRWSDAIRTERTLLPLSSHPDQAVAEQARLQGLRYEQALVAEGDGAVTRELRALVAESPHFLPAVVALGDRLRAQGQHRDAGLVWTRAARLRPEPLLLSRIEAVYRDLGRAEKVLAFYRRLRRRADTPILRLRYARWLLSLGKTDEAAAELANPTPDIERLREFHVLQADIHRIRGSTDLALEALGRALDREAAMRRPYHCRSCGHHATEWTARCADCGAWDTLRPVADVAA